MEDEKDWIIVVLIVLVFVLSMCLVVLITGNKASRVITGVPDGAQTRCVECESAVVFAGDVEYAASMEYCSVCGKKFIKTILEDR